MGMSTGTQKPNPATEAEWGAAAMLRAIADLGPIVGPVAFTAELAAATAAGASGFAAGGYTGDGGKYDVAGVVHKGEYVFNSDAVKRIGADNLDAMHRGSYGGSNSGGSAGGSAGSSKPSQGFHFYSNPSDLANQLAKSSYGEDWVVDVVNRNIHKWR